MRTFMAFVTGAALLTTAATADAAVHSSAKANSTLSADAIWTKIGGFCGISQWHPAIEKCELSADGKQRTLTLKGGGTLLLTERVDSLQKYVAFVQVASKSK